MDRLVCGDVGFGKTEVALRAAFAAAMAGVQVAVVVPTTLLARQHFRTFSDASRACRCASPSCRAWSTPKEAKLDRDELAAGTMDIVVGTHAHPVEAASLQAISASSSSTRSSISASSRRRS